MAAARKTAKTRRAKARPPAPTARRTLKGANARRKNATRAANRRRAKARPRPPAPTPLESAAATAKGIVAGAVAAIAERLPWTDSQPDAITLLTTDHDRLRTLLDAGASTTARGANRRTTILRELRSALTIHELIEEALLYPALRQHPEATSQVLEGIQEHHVADLVLGELDELQPGDPEWGAKFKVLKENVEHHIDEEESELFRVGRGVLSREELLALGEQMAAMKREAEARG